MQLQAAKLLVAGQSKCNYRQSKCILSLSSAFSRHGVFTLPQNRSVSLVVSTSFKVPLRVGAQLASSFFGSHPTRHPRGVQAAFPLLPPEVHAVNPGVASRVGPENLSATHPVPPLGPAPFQDTPLPRDR